ncbi:hypothetical protein KIPB_002964 [Kipferlia bialata]|uniref:Uncharacterized protein n=1 Tax=Kipferlia bialata TaxID=797122 RepID=A0A9K3CSN9_9EUKA|nr:hypothetical protein KIPB_002964 [Kipferlia bialata]|eukprot:g2964.t1
MFHSITDATPEGGVAVLGGKGRSLSVLCDMAQEMGFEVPAGFVITAEAFRTHVEQTETGASIRTLLSEAQDVHTVEGGRLVESSVLDLVRALSLPSSFSDALLDRVTSLLEGQDSDTLLAVRSSSIDEDGAEDAFAGLHDTVLGVDPTDSASILDAVKRVWASLYSARALAYRHQKAQARDTYGSADVTEGTMGDAIAVIVQIMPSRVVSAGVAFSADPVTNDRCTVRVESVHGLGEALVSGRCDADLHLLSTKDVHLVAHGTGQGAPDSGTEVAKYWLKDRTIKAKQLMIVPEREATSETDGQTPEGAGHLTREIDITDTPKSKSPSMSKTEALRLAGVAARVALRMGTPQDIEFCLAGDTRTLYILQSRPITSLFPVPEVTYNPVPSNRVAPEGETYEGEPPRPAQHLLVNFGAVQNMVDPFTVLGGWSAFSAMMCLDSGNGAAQYPICMQTPDFQMWLDMTGFLCKSWFYRIQVIGKMQFIGDYQMVAAMKAALKTRMWSAHRPRGKDMTQVHLEYSGYLTNPMRVMWTMFKDIMALVNDKSLLFDSLDDAMAAAAPIAEGLVDSFNAEQERTRLEREAKRETDRQEREAKGETVRVEGPVERALLDAVDIVRYTMDDFMGLVGPCAVGIMVQPGLAKIFKKHKEDPAIMERGVPNNPTSQMNMDIARLAGEAVRCHVTTLGSAPTPLVPYLLSTPWLEGADTDMYTQGQRVVEFVAGLEGPYPAFHAALTSVLAKWMHRGPSEIDIGRLKLQDDPTSALTAVVGTLKRVQAERAERGEGEVDWTSLSEEDMEVVEQVDRECEKHEQECMEVMHRISDSLSGSSRQKFNRKCALYRTCAGLREAPKDLMLRGLTPLGREGVAVMRAAITGPNSIYPECPETPQALAAMCSWRDLIPIAQAVDRVAAGEEAQLEGVITIETIRDRLKRYLHIKANPGPVRKVITTLDGCIHDAAISGHKDAPEGALVGIPVSAGTVTGTARVIMDISDAHRLEKGDILVAPYSDPGWTSVFSLASGVVLEVGGFLTHGSVVARELGLPGVVSVANCTRKIQDGDTLTVDGDRGYVVVVEEEEEGVPAV